MRAAVVAAHGGWIRPWRPFVVFPVRITVNSEIVKTLMVEFSSASDPPNVIMHVALKNDNINNNEQMNLRWAAARWRGGTGLPERAPGLGRSRPLGSS